MITLNQRPDEATQTKEKPCRWIATCDIDGQHFEAQARLDAANALARILVDTGVEDQPVILTTAGVRGHMSFQSLHNMANWSYEESATAPLRVRKWQQPPVWEKIEFRGQKAVEADSDRPEQYTPQMAILSTAPASEDNL